MSSNSASSEQGPTAVSPPMESTPRAPASFATLVRDLKLRILELVAEDDTVPRRGSPRRFWPRGNREESHSMALVALGSVSREWHELARPFLWKGVRIPDTRYKARLHHPDQLEEILTRHAQFVTVLIVNDNNILPLQLDAIVEEMGSLRRLELTSSVGSGPTDDPAGREQLVRTIAGLHHLEEISFDCAIDGTLLQLAVDATWSSPLRRIAIEGDSPPTLLSTSPAHPERISSTTLLSFLAKFSDTLESISIDYPIAPPKPSTLAPVLPPYLLRNLHHVHLGSGTTSKLALCNTLISRSPGLRLLSLEGEEREEEEEWEAMLGTCKVLGIEVEVGCKAGEGVF